MGQKKEKSNTEETTTSTETALDKPEETSLAATLGYNNELFMERYAKDVERVASALPTSHDLQKVLDDLPDEMADGISEIIRRASGKRKGVYDADGRPDFPELRIYHGTGNDPNRPENQIPGHYYLTTKENVGPEFEGTVVALWAGRTMWGDADAGDSVRMPICNSMDRKMGSTYGECESCPHRPWKDGQKQKCANDVVAFMLSKNLEDIVLVRFQKTSEPAGKQLLKFVKRSTDNWAKWYRITAEAKTNTADRNRRWYVMVVEPEEELVPEELHPFCDLMCSMLEYTHVIPGIASVYRQAKEALDDNGGPKNEGDGGGSAGLITEDDAKGGPDYGDMGDAPDDEANV